MKQEDVLAVLKAWSHKDTWNVDAIYIGTAVGVIEALQAGVPVEAIVRHAGHTSRHTVACLGVDYFLDRVRS